MKTAYIGLDLMKVTNHRQKMTFRQYIQQLAMKIGLHQIPVVLDATEIRHFLAEDAVHHDFVTTLVREIYKNNMCGHLDAAIDRKKTLSLLGNTRTTQLAETKADICRIRLINQLCEVSSEILAYENQSQVLAEFVEPTYSH